MTLDRRSRSPLKKPEGRRRASSVTRRRRPSVEEGRQVTHAFKEFVAHGSNVNCLSLGHKSGRVLVTGGDDKKVNLWAVGKPNCILSLSGHSTAVECVRFGASEELVCAGSLSGALKIWDLEATKIVRTLTGHKANIRSIDFHPYGDFICTGSLDTNIKLWDIRRKGCIFTYKGHNLTVNSLKFSPDGQWIASAGEDCAVKLWDLRAGKMLTEFASHTGPVSDVEFHPHEFLLASASHDRTVNFWDLEKFSLVSTTEADTGPVRTIAFHPTGECIYAGATDVLKVYGWEPNRCLDTVAMGWGKIADVAIAQNQLIGAAYHGIHVSLYVVDLARVQPFGGPAAEAPPFRHGAPLRKSFIKDKSEGKASLASLKTEEASDTGGDETVEEDQSLHIDNIGAFRDAFGRHRELQRTPPPNTNVTSAGISNNNVPHATSTPDLIRPIARRPLSPVSVINTPSPEQSRRTSFTPQKNTRFEALSGLSQPAISNLQADRRRGSTNDLSTIHSSPHREHPHGRNGNIQSHRSRTVSESRRDPYHNIPQHEQRYPIQSSPSEPYLVRQSSSPGPPPLSSSPPVKYAPSNQQPHTYMHRQSVTSVESRQSSKSIQSSNELPSKLIDRSHNTRSDAPPVISYMGTVKEPQDYSYRPEKLTDHDYMGPYSAGINIEDFLPKQFNALSLANIGGIHNGLTGIAGTEMSEQEVLSSIVRGHSNMTSVLLTRVRGLQSAHRTWLTKDLRTAVEHVLSVTDQALLVDFLAILNLRPSIWNLDILTLLLPPVSLLMQSKYEAYCTCGADTLKLMVKNFAPMIRSNMGGPIHSVGIDISREERYNKCMECYNHLMSIRAFLLKRQTVPGKLGHLYRELVIIMQALD